MRTTLNIDEDVLRAAKELARRDHTTAGVVISELARRSLLATESTVEEPSALYGFRPFSSRGAIVTNEDIDRLREEAAC